MFLHFAGVLTGCGKQKIGAAVNLGAFYLVGIPVAVLLSFYLHLNGMVLTSAEFFPHVKNDL